MDSMDTKNKPKLCKCGCGETTNQKRNGSYNDFINHHAIRINNPAQTESFKERMRGENNPSKRPEVIAKIRKSFEEKKKNGWKRPPVTEETRKKLSIANKGEKNSMYGMKGELHPCYGKPSPLKGIPIPEERKKKISESNKGKPKSEEHKRKISKTFKEKGISNGENNPFYGKIHDDESKLKISQVQKKKHGMDENHPQWNEILSPLMAQIRYSTKTVAWRKSVFKRDDFTCQKCGKRGGGELQAHHCNKMFIEIFEENEILTLSQAMECEEFWNIDNGMTLCVRCHNKIRHIRKKDSN